MEGSLVMFKRHEFRSRLGSLLYVGSALMCVCVA